MSTAVIFPIICGNLMLFLPVPDARACSCTDTHGQREICGRTWMLLKKALPVQPMLQAINRSWQRLQIWLVLAIPTAATAPAVPPVQA